MEQDVLIVLTFWAHVIAAPYTKVEESFNLHAIHDIIFYGVSPEALQHYDHVEFPGAVPRSFIGSLLLAYITKPLVYTLGSLDLLTSKFDVQILLRLVLATVNAIGISLLRRATRRRFSDLEGALFTLLTMSQYHLPFWIGRTLPNMFAIFPVNVAFFLLFDRTLGRKGSRNSLVAAIGLLVFASVVLRAELAMLLGPLAFQLLATGKVACLRLLLIGFTFSVICVGATVLVDSYFWNTWPIWPELQSVLFNVVEGKSVDWGVSPFHSYLSSHLPKMLMGSLPLAVFAWLADYRVRQLLLSSLLFIGLISFIGHKEWRFIIYTVPLFNIAAARGASLLMTSPRSWPVKFVFRAGVVGLVLLNAVATIAFTVASRANYAGGEALSYVNKILDSESNVHIHIDNLAAQTGASLFLHINAPPSLSPFLPSPASPWIYDKTENATNFSSFTHILHEDKYTPAWTTSTLDFINRTELMLSPNPLLVQDMNHHLEILQGEGEIWNVVAAVKGLSGWKRSVSHYTLPVPVLDVRLWILEKLNREAAASLLTDQAEQDQDVDLGGL
ncbi:hypothetical protein SISNIDRAFT_455762 [Sistotremastrum niveocremeum HHB9708]|uniref:Mannosyltransferase n=2 Tax=Sistotremastraceae TaxID=3402574 RepID=A0A164TPJ0_9AGAM|nr:hypothetical protein SISNIDRAFT_455762 [Sistotremastrum niveocremeum HHB9708]KZT42201.1 hypothetical protein SISSUDRAFT_1041833 [Sistotremastrum suecicum HHB10207 ss-3]